MATKKNGFNTGIASEYLVLSMLYRLNYEAYITMGNKKSVDIWIMRDDKTAVSIDVKSVREYDSIPVGNVEAKDNHYVIFVIYNKKPRTKSAALLKPDARPSIPSIRFIAFVIKITVNIVKGIPNQADN